MCKLRHIDEEGISGVVAYNGYAEVNFRSEAALNKCIFNLSIMMGDRTWIHSTRRQGAVPTLMTFKNVATEIPDSVIIYYTLLFRNECNLEYLQP